MYEQQHVVHEIEYKWVCANDVFEPDADVAVDIEDESGRC